MIKNCVIIPARGGSVRLPKKNILHLAGMPLLVHSINYAKKFPNICHKIVVSTDDKEIKRIALNEGVTVIDRPKNISGDYTPTKVVLKHAISELNENFDNVILLQATNPLRRDDLLREAFSSFIDNQCDSLMTVTENKQKFGKVKNNKFIPYNYHFGQRSQDLEPLFYENGLLYISKAELIKSGEIIGDNNFPFIENHIYATIDIDEKEDFELAEYYFTKIKK